MILIYLSIYPFLALRLIFVFNFNFAVGVSLLFRFSAEYPAMSAELDIHIDKGLGPSHKEEISTLISAQVKLCMHFRI